MGGTGDISSADWVQISPAYLLDFSKFRCCAFLATSETSSPFLNLTKWSDDGMGVLFNPYSGMPVMRCCSHFDGFNAATLLRNA